MSDRHKYDNIVEQLRQTRPDVDEKISNRNTMNQAQWQQGQSYTAADRIEHLQTVADAGWNPNLKKLVTFGVACLAVAGFSLGFRTVLRKSGNQFADGASAVFAIVLVYFIDDRATKVVGKLRSRHDTRSAIASIEESQASHVPNTETINAFFDGSKSLIRDREAQNLKINIRGDLISVILGVSVEAIAAIVLIYPTGGVLLALLGAALPITCICLAAAFQSDRFEYPENCEQLIPGYEQFLPITDFVDDEAMLEVLKLAATTRYISGKNGNGFKSLKQAEFATEYEFCQERQLHYKTAEIENIRARKARHNDDLEALPERFNPSDRDLSDCSPSDIDNIRNKWIESEKSRLEQVFSDDINFIHSEGVAKLQFWKERSERAQANLNRDDLDEHTAA
jgi:hypothetical protein